MSGSLVPGFMMPMKLIFKGDSTRCILPELPALGACGSTFTYRTQPCVAESYGSAAKSGASSAEHAMCMANMQHWLDVNNCPELYR